MAEFSPNNHQMACSYALWCRKEETGLIMYFLHLSSSYLIEIFCAIGHMSTLEELKECDQNFIGL